MSAWFDIAPEAKVQLLAVTLAIDFHGNLRPLFII